MSTSMTTLDKAEYLVAHCAANNTADTDIALRETALSGLLEVMDSVREHLAVFGGAVGLDIPVAISLSPKCIGVTAALQLSGLGLASLAVRLLDWADTLTNVTVDVWHTDSGSLHVYVGGRLTDGLNVEVWGGASLTDDIPPVPRCRETGRTPVELDALRYWAGLPGVDT